jgi:hypothetical protein
MHKGKNFKSQNMGVVLTVSSPFDPPQANKKGLSFENDTENIAPCDNKVRIRGLT